MIKLKPEEVNQETIINLIKNFKIGDTFIIKASDAMINNITVAQRAATKIGMKLRTERLFSKKPDGSKALSGRRLWRAK